MLFAEIIGLNEIKESLLQAVKQNHLAHALLFHGPDGSGALPLARALATYVNCEAPGESDACGTCAACTKNRKLIHPDFHMVFPAYGKGNDDEDSPSAAFIKEWRDMMLEHPFSTYDDWVLKLAANNKQLAISVQEARHIIRSLSLKPYEAPYKIMLIWLPEFMNQSAANAVLKVLEEPSYKTLFLLVCAQPEKMLPTVLSRTQKIQVRAFSDEEIEQYLIQQHQIDSTRANKLAHLADGSLREANQLLFAPEDDDHQAVFRDWMRLCYTKGKFQDVFPFSDQLAALSREQQKRFIQTGLEVLRECMLFNNGREDLLRMKDADREFVSKFAKVLSDGSIDRFQQELNTAYYHIERNANAKILFTDLTFTFKRIFQN